ncbi:hypothetical protein GS938_19985 [Rhodococcus hoagii]|nr:hypothetical protein [Prescottella equi]NKW08015.1 hypothetical protein [Prescottella equi]
MSDLYRLVSKSWQPPGTRDRITRGTVFTPPENQIDRLLRIGAIVAVDGAAEPGPDADTSSPDGSGDESSEGTSADGDAEADADADTPAGHDQDTERPAAAETERPKQAAPKAVWVEYAVAGGMDRDAAEGLDKRELIAALS